MALQLRHLLALFRRRTFPVRLNGANTAGWLLEINRVALGFSPFPKMEFRLSKANYSTILEMHPEFTRKPGQSLRPDQKMSAGGSSSALILNYLLNLKS